MGGNEVEYQYPFSMDWTRDEVIEVISFFQMIEKAYERGVQQSEIMEAYRRFKKIVPSIAEEKRIGKEFEQSSGYSLYRTMQKAKKTESNEIIKM